MPVEYICPVHREPLRADGPDRLVGVVHGLSYPIVDGIPVLLPDEQERQRLSRPAVGERQTSSAIAFYNQAQIQETYFFDVHDLDELKSEIEGWLKQTGASGPTLEVGSGRGHLQGLGEGYVALDYSLPALCKCIAARHQRVCGSAASLPFRDQTFGFVFTTRTLEHVPEADKAFDEVDRVLKPGGVAYVLPAWHCVQWRCEGISVRPYRDLTIRQKLIKLSLPIRTRPAFKALSTLPGRLLRRGVWVILGGRPTRYRFTRLRPDYKTFWEADSDAAARLDSHEACLYFASRGYQLLSPAGGVLSQLLLRHAAVVVRKPSEGPRSSADTRA